MDAKILNLTDKFLWYNDFKSEDSGTVTEVLIFNSKKAADNFAEHCKSNNLKKINTMIKNKTVRRFITNEK